MTWLNKKISKIKCFFGFHNLEDVTRSVLMAQVGSYKEYDILRVAKICKECDTIKTLNGNCVSKKEADRIYNELSVGYYERNR